MDWERSAEVDGDESPVDPPSVAVLRVLAGMPEDVRRSPEASQAYYIALELERGRALSSAAVSKELTSLVDRLRGMAGASGKQEDPLDELARHRVTRLSDATA